tara:strand:- start:54 stop:632 length:579 start_codon:yes stop_codon:yes gene_type:complete
MKIVENKFSSNKFSIEMIKPIKHPSCSECPVIEEEDLIPKRSPSLVKAQQKYYQKNKEKITHKQMLYNVKYNKLTTICPCGDVITNASKYHHLKSQRHKRRLDNIKNGKFAGSTAGEEIVNCGCGGHYIYKHRHQHFKTKKHVSYIIEQQEKLRTQLTQKEIRTQLRLMLLGENIVTDDASDKINSSVIKEI